MSKKGERIAVLEVKVEMLESMVADLTSIIVALTKEQPDIPITSAFS